MQSINQLTKQLTSQQTILTNLETSWNSSTDQTATQTTELKQSTSLIIGLFEDWQRMFGSKLKDRQYLDLRTAELWALALRNAGMTMKEFNAAAVASLNLEWPPTAAVDFIKLARPQNKQYPDVQTAFYTACKAAGMRGMAERDWGHAVVLETANRLGWGNLERASEGYITHFAKVYEQVVAEHQAGASFVIKKERRIEPPKPAKLDPNSKVGQDWQQLLKNMGIKRRTAEV